MLSINQWTFNSKTTAASNRSCSNDTECTQMLGTKAICSAISHECFKIIKTSPLNQNDPHVVQCSNDASCEGIFGTRVFCRQGVCALRSDPVNWYLVAGVVGIVVIAVWICGFFWKKYKCYESFGSSYDKPIFVILP